MRLVEHVGDRRAQIPEGSATRSHGAEWLDGLRGFRVEWNDGSVGVVGGIAIVVHTAGFGSGHPRLELITGDDVVAIIPDERRMLVRARVPPAVAIGDAVRHVLRRRLGRLVGAPRRDPG